jgi:hypothetical protein
MANTVLALFRERRDAEAAVRALRSADFDSATIGIAHPGDAGRVPRYGIVALKGVLGGTIGCGLIGVIAGLIVGGLLPMTHPLLPGGWFVPFMLGMAGAGTGAVAGLLASQSTAERGAYYYDDEVRAGRTLVTVHAAASRVAEARRILLEQGAFDASPIDAPMRKAS